MIHGATLATKISIGTADVRMPKMPRLHLLYVRSHDESNPEQKLFPLSRANIQDEPNASIQMNFKVKVL